jgi:hypothetical protein
MKPTIATRDEFNDYKKTEGRKNIRQGGGFIKQSNQQGRFTPNLLVCDDMLNDGKISISEGGKTTRDTAHFGGATFKMEGYGDKGTNSRYYDLDKWFDKVIDEIQ